MNSDTTSNIIKIRSFKIYEDTLAGPWKSCLYRLTRSTCVARRCARRWARGPRRRAARWLSRRWEERGARTRMLPQASGGCVLRRPPPRRAQRRQAGGAEHTRQRSAPRSWALPRADSADESEDGCAIHDNSRSAPPDSAGPSLHQRAKKEIYLLQNALFMLPLAQLSTVHSYRLLIVFFSPTGRISIKLAFWWDDWKISCCIIFTNSISTLIF